jgi:thymidylate kinase
MLARMWSRQEGSGLPLMARFLAQRLRDRLSPHGLLVSVSGPDGSGKTTVIDLALAQLRQIYGPDAVEYHHFRPSMLPRIAQMAKAAGAVGTVDADYSRPHRARSSGVAGSLLRLGYYGMDYVLGYLRVIRPALTKRRIVLFDRYYYDMICDPGRSRIELPRWYLRAMARLLPLPDLAFFVKVAPDLAHGRKPELTRDEIAALNTRYGDLVRRGWMIEIENEGPAEQAATAIVDRIVAHRGRAAWQTLGKACR